MQKNQDACNNALKDLGESLTKAADRVVDNHKEALAVKGMYDDLFASTANIDEATSENLYNRIDKLMDLDKYCDSLI